MAELSVPNFFGDHMVLQRGIPLPVWGIGESGSAVKVSFGEQSHETKVQEDGQWRVVLDAMPASAEPRTFSVHSGEGEIDFEDVLVG